MKKLRILAVVAIAMMVLSISAPVLASDTATVDVTFATQELSIAVNPPAWENYGAIPNKEWTSATNGFTLVNNSNCKINTTIEGDDAEGNKGHTWTLSSDGNNGTGTYGMKFTTDGTNYTPLTTTPTSFINGLDGGGAYRGFGLYAKAPSNGESMSPGETFHMVVTIKAVFAD